MENFVPKEERVQIGQRMLTDYLVEQAGYTLGIAAAEGAVLLDLLPEEFLADARAVLDRVSAAHKDKTLAAEEAKDATQSQNAAAERAKIWRRKASRRAARATRFGHPMPSGLLTMGKTPTLAALAGQIKEMTTLFEQNLDTMPGKDAPALLAEGKEIAARLTTADAAQEVLRRRELPIALLRFYEEKGTLYLALKAINDAGQELHADNPVEAARYNLHLLHRRNAHRKSAPEASAE